MLVVFVSYKVLAHASTLAYASSSVADEGCSATIDKPVKFSGEASSFGTSSTASALVGANISWDFSSWTSSDATAAKNATNRAIDFLAHWAADPSHRVLNTASFFVELAGTAPENNDRARAQVIAVNFTNGLAHRALQRMAKGTFGQLLGCRHDLLEVMQLLTYQAELGQKVEGMGPHGLLSRTKAEFKRCGACTSLPERGCKDPAELVDKLLAAYVIDEARYRFGESAFPTRKGHLAQALKMARAPFATSEVGVTDASKSSGFLQRFSQGETVGQSEAKLAKAFSMKALLATHIVFVLNGFDRFATQRSAAPEVIAWLRGAFPAILKSGDVELIGEVVASFRAMGCSFQEDAMVRAGARALIRAQRQDGAWGAEAHFATVRAKYGLKGEAYDVLHHVWTPTSALRLRRSLGDVGINGSAADAYGQHLRQALGVAELAE